jgi:hypothetical protein
MLLFFSIHLFCPDAEHVPLYLGVLAVYIAVAKDGRRAQQNPVSRLLGWGPGMRIGRFYTVGSF